MPMVNTSFASWIIHASIIKEKNDNVKKKTNLFLIAKKMREMAWFSL
jgi:hypothetical protein